MSTQAGVDVHAVSKSHVATSGGGAISRNRQRVAVPEPLPPTGSAPYFWRRLFTTVTTCPVGILSLVAKVPGKLALSLGSLDVVLDETGYETPPPRKIALKPRLRRAVSILYKRDNQPLRASVAPVNPGRRCVKLS